MAAPARGPGLAFLDAPGGSQVPDEVGDVQKLGMWFIADNPTHYAVVQARLTVPQVTLAGQAPPSPVIDPEQPVINILMVRALDLVGRWSLTNRVIVDGSTSAEELSAAFAISTYPNPFTEGITVRIDDGQPVRVILYDPQGKLIYDETLNGETRIDLSQHANGSYTAFFWKEMKRIHRVQLVKQ